MKDLISALNIRAWLEQSVREYLLSLAYKGDEVIGFQGDCWPDNSRVITSSKIYFQHFEETCCFYLQGTELGSDEYLVSTYDPTRFDKRL
jgi:hypothetical protein